MWWWKKVISLNPLVQDWQIERVWYVLAITILIPSASLRITTTAFEFGGLIRWFSECTFQFYQLLPSNGCSALMFGYSQHDKKWGNDCNTPGAFRAGHLPTGLRAMERVAAGVPTPANFTVKVQAANPSTALTFLDPVISLLGINQKEIISIYTATLCTEISSARLFITLQKNEEYPKYPTMQKWLGKYW